MSVARALAGRIAELARALDGRAVRLMEVCGSHTMAIARHGIRDMLPGNVRLLSGPGCPVCVTEPGYVDAALALARRGVGIATFGDMLRVPGSDGSLASARAEGAVVRAVYSPARALELAAAEPDRPWVMLAVGFETTAAPLAALALEIRRRGVGNLALLCAPKRVPPALDALVADPELAVDGFLCPAHVSAIIGARAYEPYARDHGRPCVVASFEPLDVLHGLAGLLEQIVAGEARVDNRYARVVRPEGNPAARRVMAEVFEAADARWRGLGTLPRSGLRLRESFADLDAERVHGVAVQPGREPPGCRCGEVLAGRTEPEDCPLFDRTCTPAHPVGPCMVSSEGSCAAAWKYRGSQGRKS